MCLSILPWASPPPLPNGRNRLVQKLHCVYLQRVATKDKDKDKDADGSLR